MSESLPMLPAVHQLLSRPDTDRHIFNITFLWEVHMPVDDHIMEQAVAFLLRHHDGLRARFRETEYGWGACIVEPDDDDVPVMRIDLSMFDEEQQSVRIEIEAERLQGTLDLANGPLLRVAHFFLGRQRPCRLLFIVHHFVCDAFSFDLLQQDFFTVYHQIRQGQVAQLPPKTTSVQSYGECLVAYAHSETIQKEVDYWVSGQRRKIEMLPVDYPEGMNVPAVRESILCRIDEQETRLLLALAKQRIAVSDVLLAVLFQTYRAWTGERSMLVEISHHGRQPPFQEVDLSRTVGWVANPVPFLLHSESAEDMRDVVRSVREQLRLIPHNGLGAGVLRYLGSREVQELLRSLPQPQLLLNYVGRLPFQIDEAQVFMRPARESVRNVLSRHMIDPIQICVTAILRGKILEITWNYQENLYKRATMEGLMDDFLQRLISVPSSGSREDESSSRLQ
jgi:non-ribosomal peptide synthase protein (TIGR01720 family)